MATVTPRTGQLWTTWKNFIKLKFSSKYFLMPASIPYVHFITVDDFHVFQPFSSGLPKVWPVLYLKLEFCTLANFRVDVLYAHNFIYPASNKQLNWLTVPHNRLTFKKNGKRETKAFQYRFLKLVWKFSLIHWELILLSTRSHWEHSFKDFFKGLQLFTEFLSETNLHFLLGKSTGWVILKALKVSQDHNHSKRLQFQNSRPQCLWWQLWQLVALGDPF